MRTRRWLVAMGACAVVAASCGRGSRLALPAGLGPEDLTLAGEFNIPPLSRFPPAVGLPFGGISALAPLGGGQWLAASDERHGSRIYRLEMSGEGARLHVAPVDVIGLEAGGGAPAALDPEGIAVTPRDTIIIASEGAGSDVPRVPPALAEYNLDGRFIRRFELRDRFIPTPVGAPTRGVRDNAALESLTMVPGGRRFFSATETALVQDGEPAAVGRGAVARILEYVREDDTYVPAREFAYELEPIDPAPFDAAGAMSGLVELLALDDDHLLALERTYMRERAATGRRPRSLNRIRLYRLSLEGATDVSALDSLTGALFTPVRKTLALDLSDLQGLSPELASLENFEGLSVGPRLRGGSPSLLLVSDDNFGADQRTSFVLLRVGGGQ